MPRRVLRSKDHFEDVVALYSQHFARPPSASRPQQASGGRGRRRPRSASAAITSTGPQLSPSADVSASGTPRDCHEKVRAPSGRPSSTTSRRARPASAAAVAGGARARPAPPRPSRPRPVTATGATNTFRKGSRSHDQGNSAYCKPGIPLVKALRRGSSGGQQQRRRVVSAGGYPSSLQGGTRNSVDRASEYLGVGSIGDGWIATNEPAREYVKGSHESRAACSLGAIRGDFDSAGGSSFYHKHKDIASDSEVMQRAAEFVSKILKAGKNKQGQQNEPPPTSQSNAAPLMQSPKAWVPGNCTAVGGTAKKYGGAGRRDACPARGRRRQRTQEVCKVQATATPSDGSVLPQAATQASEVGASTIEDDAVSQTSSRQQQRKPKQGKRWTQGTTNYRSSASTCEFPFPPRGTGEDLHDRTLISDGNEEDRDEKQLSRVGQRENSFDEGLVDRLAGDEHSVKPTKKEEVSHSPMTPLAFDVFCSLRPTFFKDKRSKQKRSNPIAATATLVDGTGLLSGAPGGEIFKRNCPVPATFSVGDYGHRPAPCTWTSVFGAARAGAERGRARAKVLKVARREAMRKKRRKRCAASPAVAAAAVPHLSPTYDVPHDGNASAASPADASNDRALVNIYDEKDFLAIKSSPETGAADSTMHGYIKGAELLSEGRGDVFQSATCPLFRHPHGGGTTRIGVNAPRSLQVCPGDRGSCGVLAETSRLCFSAPRRPRSREGLSAPPHGYFSQSPPRRPATACDAPRDSVPYFGAETNGGSPGDRAGRTRRDVRPETAWSFFSKGASNGKGGIRWLNSSKCSRWTDGERLLRRVDNIADSIAKGFLSHHCGTQGHGDTRSRSRTLYLQDGGEDGGEEMREVEVEKQIEGSADEGHRDHPEAGDASPPTAVPIPSTEQRNNKMAPEGSIGVGSDEHLQPPTLDADTDEDAPKLGPVGAQRTADLVAREQCAATAKTSVCATGDKINASSDDQNVGETSGIDAVHTPGVCPIDAPCLSGDSMPTQCVQVHRTPTASGVQCDKPTAVAESKSLDAAVSPLPAPTAAFGSSNNITTSDGTTTTRTSRRRSMARPVSASGRSAGNNPNSRFGFFCGLRRSVSSPGLLQGSHNPGHSLVDIVDIAEAWKHLGGRDSPVLVGEAVNVRSAEDAVGAVPDGPASKDSVRVACGDGPEGVSCSAHGDTRGRGGLEGGNAYKFSSKTEAGHHQQGMELGQDSTADAALADGDTKRSPSGGVFEPGTDVVARAGCVSKPQLSSRSASVAVPTKPETPLDFRKATVKLKVLAAEASVAVDGHEKAWRNSKERAEHTFNDLRFAAEEDAQRSGDAAAMETRHRLQRIIVEAGLENSRRVEKEAALEEICRVLRQDTSVYEARASASDNMLHRIRALEAENDNCDRSVLLECHRNKSLILLRDRTERERDELRAVCRWRREEAEVMDHTLAEARHARGLLLGHTQHTVDRMACLAEYVGVMRRWLRDKLTSRSHARVTSKAINLEFERKSQELDAILKKEAPASTRTSRLYGGSRTEPNQSRGHTKKSVHVAPPPGFDNLDLSVSLESFRDSSSRLRGLLLLLKTNVSSAQKRVEFAQDATEGRGD